jgi:hypothetical protein
MIRNGLKIKIEDVTDHTVLFKATTSNIDQMLEDIKLKFGGKNAKRK